MKSCVGVQRVYIALVLVDLHGVLHLRQRFHAGVVRLSLLTVILLLIELLQKGVKKRNKPARNEGVRRDLKTKREKHLLTNSIAKNIVKYLAKMQTQKPLFNTLKMQTVRLSPLLLYAPVSDALLSEVT